MMLWKNTYNELIKIAAKPRSYIGIAAITLIVAIILFAMKIDGLNFIAFVTRYHQHLQSLLPAAYSGCTARRPCTYYNNIMQDSSVCFHSLFRSRLFYASRTDRWSPGTHIFVHSQAASAAGCWSIP